MKTSSYILLICLFLNSFNVYGGEPEPSVKYLEKDEKAPFSGYLFTPLKEKELRFTNENFKYCEEAKEYLNKILKAHQDKEKILEERLALKDNQIDNMAKTLAETRDTGFFTKMGFFVLGALVTTGIAYGVSRSIGR